MTNRRATAAVLATTAVMLLGGYSDQLGDRPMTDDVPITDLEGVRVYRNIDGFPNITRACADGLAFAMTSSENGPAMLRVPEWDTGCGDVG